MAISVSVMFYCFLFLIWIVYSLLPVQSFIKTCANSRTVVRQPPSPPALPIIGHLYLLSFVLPKSFQTLACRYGPLMQLRLGASTCIVVSNAIVAEEILKTHELNFTSRPEFSSSDYNIYRGSRFVTAQYGAYWRFMRKLCITRLFASSQLNRFIHIREEETMTNNVICRMAMSTRCSENANEAMTIKELVKEVLELAGKLSLGEVLGPLAKFDLFGNGRKLKLALRRFDRLVEQIMKDHEDKEIKGCEREGRDLMDNFVRDL